MPKIKTAMPGLFWVAQYAQGRSDRYTLAVVSFPVHRNGPDSENQVQEQLNVFLVVISVCPAGLDPR